MKIQMSLSLERISYFLKKYYFWILGIILLLLLCFNAFIYYQYVYVTINTQVAPTNEQIAIDEEVLDKVMDSIEERKDTLIRVKLKNYYNPFDN